MLPHRTRLAGMTALTAVTLASIAGCMVMPRTVSSYNADCQVVERHMTLEAQQIGALARCHNNAECATLLAVYGLVAATSAVVSGSVAVVGNVAYWIEKQGQCARPAPERSRPETQPPASQGALVLDLASTG